jgi:hypothetical protein
MRLIKASCHFKNYLDTGVKQAVMRFRIFIAIMILLNVLFAYKIFHIYTIKQKIYSVPLDFSIGPEQPNLTVIEFFDYNCQGCRDIDLALMEAINKDGKVKYAPRIFAEAGTEQEERARMLYAAAMQKQMLPMHEELMHNQQPMDNTLKTQIAGKLGLNLKKFDADMKSSEIKNYTAYNIQILHAFQPKPSAGPMFMIGPQLIYKPQKTPTADKFLTLFNQARQAGS